MYERDEKQKTLEYVTKKNAGVLGWKYEVKNNLFNTVGLLPAPPVEEKYQKKLYKVLSLG